MYFLLLAALVLTSLLIFNTLASILATFIWRAQIAAGFVNKLTARQKSQRIFALRVFPPIAAFIFITAFLLPAYFLFEPNKSGETVSTKLILLTSISVLGIFSAVYRVFLTWQATRRLTQNWLREAEPITIEGVSIPVYSIQHPFPVIAVVGAFRPQMFIARQIFDSLERGEIQAAIAHEQGHLISKDNLKRALMRFCRDLLLFHHGRQLERAWAESAEIVADEYAAGTGGNKMALNLASALIKIARMVPPETCPAMPAGAFLIAESNCDISGRVRNLLHLTEDNSSNLNPHEFGSGINLWIYPSAVVSLIFFLAMHRSVLLAIHDGLEIVVKLLR